MELIPLQEEPDEIALHILDKLKKKYGSRLLLFGIKGSFAANQFTPFSDLDFVVAIKHGVSNWFEYLYGTTYIDLRVIPIDTLRKEMEYLNMQWPLKAGSILNMKVYFDAENTYSGLINIYNNLKRDPKQFENAVELNTFIAHFSKAYRAYHSDDFIQLSWSSIELTNQFAHTIALLNKSYFISRSPNNLIKQIKAFDFQPDGWEEAMILAFSKDPHDTFKGVCKMRDILNELDSKYEFRNFRIPSIASIELK
ncbi:nucleotidyltransferase domain-containing protein [Fulvivirga ulvae]|uniref:nucleotidyltransferase domain-containing protein n=1 Tax=Fulvivirga ulvae TaxID=2904245 RepID=UPI001F263585|nr:nucleotidyltransferase domain-containing protein [Fulvivirga ulvae]UII31046.1 nucleotidyltransferase domain-containing protein [Fulvivirga ulvae]